MEAEFSEDPFWTHGYALSDKPLDAGMHLRQPDVGHGLPVAGYDAVRAIALCDKLTAQRNRQEQQIPAVTPETLTPMFEDGSGARILAAQHLRKVLGELGRLEALMHVAASQKAAAVTAMRTTCWGTPLA